MGRWAASLWLVLLVGGSGVVWSGCGGSLRAPGKDAGASDVAISPRGVVGTGGAVDTGGGTTAGASGGAGNTGRSSTPGGAGGSATGGASGTNRGGAGGAGTTSPGSTGGAGGSSTAPLPDADVPDAPASGGAPGTGGTGGGSGTTGVGGAIGTGGSIASGGSGGPMATGGSDGSGGSTSPGTGPCDIYAAANPPTPCVAAYSMIRKLSSSYAGPLYQIRKDSSSQNTGAGGTTTDIGILPDGFADSAALDTFCASTFCTVSKLYDQSGKGNDLVVAKKGCYTGTAQEDDYESNAIRRSLTVGGHKVYALYMNAHEGYRNNETTGMPTGTDAQGIYEVADGKHSGTGCCWDFGNASTDNCYGASSLNALFFGSVPIATGQGSGPWFMGDASYGFWPDDSGIWGCGDSCSSNNPSLSFEYAFGVLTTEQAKGALRVANAQSGKLLTVYDGQVSKNWSMEGGIILGIGEDNSNSSYGTFYEGAITTGRPTLATDEAVLKNVQAAGYGK